MTDLRHGWKILTRDGRSPLQGGPPLLNGHFPVTLPKVRLDTGPAECASGWNYVADIPTGWQIAGMWPNGYPSRVVGVKASPDAIQRGNKRRTSSLTLLREATADELEMAFNAFSHQFGVHRSRMAQEQAAWYWALSRRHHDAGEVEAQLALTLSARGLTWSLQRFDDAIAAWAAWAAWDAWAARDARDAWSGRAARDARAAWSGRAAMDAWAAWDAWDAWAAWAAWDAWAAWAAWAALTTLYVRLMGWQAGETDQYTVGIRDAYANGLAIALPVGPSTLGWAMEEQP